MDLKIIKEARASGVLSLVGMGIVELPALNQNDVLDVVCELDVSKNQLELLSQQTIDELAEIEKICASQNKISILPDLTPLSQLEYLDLSRNALTSLPDSIGTLSLLKELQLSQNALMLLPSSIGQMKSLKVLDVSQNQLESLPAFVDLTNLEVLNVANNKLSFIPRGVGKCASLGTLNASNNRLEKLTFALRHLECLESLEVSKNPLKRPPIDVCTRGVRHTLEWLEANFKELAQAQECPGRPESIHLDLPVEAVEGDEDDSDAENGIDSSDTRIERGAASFKGKKRPLKRKREKFKPEPAPQPTGFFSSITSSVGSFVGRMFSQN